MVIKGYRVGPLLKKTGKEILRDNVFGLAAEAAYNFFFSIFPFFLFSAPIIGLIGDEQATFTWLIKQLSTVVPAEALDLVRGVVKQVVFAPNAPGIISVGVLLAAWSGSAMFGSLMGTLNRAFDLSDTRPWWKQKLIQLAAVAVTGILLGISSIIFLGGPQLVSWLGGRVLGLERYLVMLWTVVQYALAVALIVVAFFLIYRFLPNVKQSWRQILVGAMVGTALWILVTLGFRFYVSNFSNYNKTYGTIGGVIVLLTWMYLSMVVILSAGELISEIHHGTGAIEPRKGAVYAGRVVTSSDPSVPSTDRVIGEPLSASGPEDHGGTTMR